MWLMTQHGFFSVVASRDGKGYQIRARLREDIENALDILGDDELTWLRTTDADYRYRIIVDKERLLRFMNHIASHIDYPNFKDRIHHRKDQKNKEKAYFSIWSVMYELQQQENGLFHGNGK